jgi:1,4-dihydroxy-2-naphthoate octaprenyltransferase
MTAWLKGLVGVARIPFLLLPVVLVANGAAAAAYEGFVSLQRTTIALIGLLALHVAVNSLNEWSDARSEIDYQTARTPFSGGSGTIPGGRLPAAVALFFGLATSALGAAIGIWFLARVGWTFLPWLMVGATFVLGYTNFLARVGLGEVAAGLGLGGLPVTGAALVQDGTVGAAAVAAAVPATLMTFNLLLLNEFPDEDADRAGGRRNLVILLGRKPAALVYSVAGVLTPVAVIGAVLAGTLPTLALLAALPSVLLAPPLRWALSNPANHVPVPALGANVAWNLLTNLTLAVTLAVSVMW